jgi:hypothetical protein
MRLAVDETARTTSLLQVYAPPEPRLAVAMGNVQLLPDGGAFVGWGTAGAFTEFAPDGTVRFDGTLADGSSTYRAYRAVWSGQPSAPPAVVLTRSPGEVVATVSWNGATNVAFWEARVGKLRARVPSVGFETAVRVPATSGRLTVAALDVHGRELGATRAFPLPAAV